MFGSKIRSWMENHIVRPRKKGNKNKNGNSNSATPNGTQNGHKGATGYTIYHGDGTTSLLPQASAPSSTISSPARRREVSPIQSHTGGSRFGWQSPNQETAMSPKSEHFLYVPHPTIKSQTLTSQSSSSVQVKKVTASSVGATTKTLNQQPQSNTKLQSNKTTENSTKSNTKDQHKNKTKTLSPNIMFRKNSSMGNNNSNCSTAPSSVATLGQKSNLSHVHHHQHQIQNSHNSSQNHSNYHQNGKTANNGTYVDNNVSKESQREINLQNNNVKSHTKIQHNYLNQDLRSFSTNGGGKVTMAPQHCNSEESNRYGKLLPSKMIGNSKLGASMYDNGNTSGPYTINSDERIASNNNHHIGMITPNGQSTTAYIHAAHVHQQQNGSVDATTTNMPRNGYEQNRNVIRPSARHSSMLGGVTANHPSGHVLNSLSSPESAYSTGYSTDGTSPGATYTPPEYYINIRTGTHYFPKSVNTLAIEAQRNKFGLNKIEEMSPQDPLPNNHRRTESFDIGQTKIPGFGIPDLDFFQSKQQLQQQQSQPQQQQQPQTTIAPNAVTNGHSPVPQRNTIVIPSLKGFESPSPRQRCRIRTNPWYSTTDTSSSGNTTVPTFLAKKVEMDASSSSSGIKSSSDAGGISDKNEKNEKSSDESESTSSSTEIENLQRTYSPNTIRRKKAAAAAAAVANDLSYRSEGTHLISHSLHQESDEDATLNEMMGKFDESYVYEKETDILSSDSDPTDCPSDLDTGQDAEDECDTDEVLDIDFIDTASIQEINDKTDGAKNRGSCSYISYPTAADSRMMKSRRSRKENSMPKRKKRLLKTRKKSAENKEKGSPIRNSRESRSLGGTPVCLRRNQSAESRKYCDSLDLEIFRSLSGSNRNFSRGVHMSPLSNRSNSLTFTEIHAVRGRFADSERALLKADLEADVKYRQLIHEAETILVSMKSSVISIPRETPVASPRRICNPPANKRVEMLRHCEADIKRELLKQQKASEALEIQNSSADSNHAINKRLELLKYETNSAPNSPKAGRCSPRKTHITNFINQIAPPETPVRRNSIPDPSPRSPQLQLNGRKMRSPIISPLTRRRFRSQSPKLSVYSDSDSEDYNQKISTTPKRDNTDMCTFEPNFQNSPPSRKRITNSRQSLKNSKDDISNRNVLPEIEKITLYNESDYTNSNVIVEANKPSLMSFKSIDMSNCSSMNSYCPQSEPLKRKIYRGSSSFERIKKSLDLESEIPKKAILDKINNIRRERHNSAMKNSNPDMNLSANSLRHEPNDDDSISSNLSTKQQLILNTIEDLKRSLEYQSVELNGLNCDDDCSQ